MVQRYGYKMVTVLFTGDAVVIHKRFLAWDDTDERHPALRSHGFFQDPEIFRVAAMNCGGFDYGDALVRVDATDLAVVNYSDIQAQIEKAVRSM